MTDVAERTTNSEPGEAEVRASVFDSIKGSRDALSVKRAFGDAYDLDGLTVIPVARVAGGAGGGAGEGEGGQEGEGSGSGFGSGYGLGVTPIGVYEVRDGSLEWKPSVDVNRMVRGGQVLVGIIAVCLTIVLVGRHLR